MSQKELDRLFSRRAIGVRDRCLWRMLYETAARAEEVLRLNIEDLDLAGRRAITVRKGDDTDVLHYATGSARLLPKVIDGRTRGPLFLAERPPSRQPDTRFWMNWSPPPGERGCPTAGPPRSSAPRAAAPPCTSSGTLL